MNEKESMNGFVCKLPKLRGAETRPYSRKQRIKRRRHYWRWMRNQADRVECLGVEFAKDEDTGLVLQIVKTRDKKTDEIKHEMSLVYGVGRGLTFIQPAS